MANTKNYMFNAGKKCLPKVIGYSDGVNDGRKREFQNGFDQGYKDGLTTSFNIQKFKSFFYHLKADEISKDLAKEKNDYETLLTADLKPLLLKQQSSDFNLQEHVDETILKFAQKIPVSTNLLNVQSSSNKL